MKKKSQILFIFILVASISLHGQDTIPKQDHTGKIFTIVEQMPSFPGGEEAMMNFFSGNVKYPGVAKKNSVEEKVYVSFIVDTSGLIVNPKVIRGIGVGCDEEAPRVIKSMPKWSPGKQDGHSVNVIYNVHVDFIIKKDKRQSKVTISDPYRNGVELLKKGMFSEAISEFDKALTINESDVDAFYNRGVAKLRINNRTGACLDWSAAVAYGDVSSLNQINRFCDSLIIFKGDTVSMTQPNLIDAKKFDTTKDKVEVMPRFIGGEAVMLKFVAHNIKYPSEAMRKNIQGRIYVNFYIDKNGDVQNAKIIKGIGGGCDQEALRVVKLMPRWKPGTLDGRPVNVNYNLPINFTLK
jgi:TonB family protein